jgi:hypothetical protein
VDILEYFIDLMNFYIFFFDFPYGFFGEIHQHFEIFLLIPCGEVELLWGLSNEVDYLGGLLSCCSAHHQSLFCGV